MVSWIKLESDGFVRILICTNVAWKEILDKKFPIDLVSTLMPWPSSSPATTWVLSSRITEQPDSLAEQRSIMMW